MKKYQLGLIIGLLAVILAIPWTGQASVSSSGSALLDWGQAVFAVSPQAGTTPVTVDWTAAGLYGIGVDTRGSLSSVGNAVNGPLDPYSAADWSDGSWANTYATFSTTAGSNNVTGAADTHSSLTAFDPATAVPANRAFASSSLLLNGPPNTTGAYFAQAVLSGQFAVSADAVLNVSIPYTLTLAMNSSNGVFDAAAFTAALVLSDFNTTDPITGQSLVILQDVQALSGVIMGAGTVGPTTISGTLLLPGVFLSALDATGAPFIYDFEASATANGSATVPEPSTLALLVSAIIGLAAFRKKLA